MVFTINSFKVTLYKHDFDIIAGGEWFNFDYVLRGKSLVTHNFKCVHTVHIIRITVLFTSVVDSWGF